MKDDLPDATSATLLGRVALSPGDTVAWDRFVGVYGPKIRGWCKRWGLQEADSEDVTQDVLLRMAQRMRTFTYDPARSFRGWLHTVTKNALAEFLAHRKRQCAGSGDDRVLELLQSVPGARTCSIASRSSSTPRCWARPSPAPWASASSPTPGRRFSC